ncbi:hypothetical protein [Nocardiopsis lambiniae]|uniref:Integral membrane protein n=1 Tax=Nocardiopsis lambiniae TaxID=3075539 RepID=A0ABU2M9H7_9ACTN|nr:hypothetical protein [Nocardiopsis sp. DSM 44743]MDT0329274.1 hypothetical protein [Nocardiopsis sp. DSM 44743]
MDRPGPPSPLFSDVRAARRVRVAIIALVIVGVGAQTVQRADPTLSLLYFTVLSALLCGIAQIGLLAGRSNRFWEPVRDAACGSLCISMLVYLTVLLPLQPLSAADGAMAWIGALCLHVPLPVLAVVDFLRSPRVRPLRHADAVTLWPVPAVVYVVVMVALAVTGVGEPPYDFLRPGLGGWPLVILSCSAISLVLVVIGLVLVRARLFLDSRALAPDRP